MKVDQFKNRRELEAYIRQNKDSITHVEGSDSVLRRFNLSERSNVYGIPVKSTSKKKEKIILNTAEMRRGKKKKILYGTSQNN